MEDEHRFCSRCGARLPLGSRYCPDCGAAVSEHPRAPVAPQPAPAPVWSPQPVQQPQVYAPAPPRPEVIPLFDKRRKYYAIDRRWWGWGSGNVYDEKGNIIGKMYRRVVSARGVIELREANDVTVSALIHKKLAAIRDTFDIKDSNEQLLARVKQKILAFIRPVVWMEDPQGDKIYEGQGDFLGFSFKVYDMNRNLIAEIDKTDMWKDIFVGGSVLDFSQHYAIVISSADVDRRLIVPLAIAIDEAIHEDRKGRE